MPECSFSQVIKSLFERSPRLPLSIKCELTHRCNFACKHCYCRLPLGMPTPEKEMALQDWDRFLTESAEQGALFLTFTGGEPLVHQQFQDIWRMAKCKGYMITLFTNAALVTPLLIDFFREYSPIGVSVTLYGATEATYRSMTGVSGMFDRVLGNIEAMKAAGLNVSTRSIITRRNFAEFEALKELNLRYSENFSWDGELFGVNATGGGHPRHERLSPQQVIEAESIHRERFHEMEKLIETHGTTTPAGEQGYRCSMGSGGFDVDPYGYIRPCQLLENLKYDFCTGTVKEAWNNALPDMLQHLHWGTSKCRNCDMSLLCKICPAMASREGASMAGPTAYHCAIGQLRKDNYLNHIA